MSPTLANSISCIYASRTEISERYSAKKFYARFSLRFEYFSRYRLHVVLSSFFAHQPFEHVEYYFTYYDY